MSTNADEVHMLAPVMVSEMWYHRETSLGAADWRGEALT